ncbi:MAG: hypothetical protein QOF40_1083, partial [Actinomycetota bacterium]|nr:hypothetical protein [Actinomycetota bacterium]
AWAYTLSASGIHTVETTLGQSLLTLEVARVSLDGTVVATDMLRGAVIDESTVAVDPDGLWVVTAMPPKRPAAHPDQTLTRVTTSGRRVVSPGVRAWSVASGDGQTWFVGTTHPLPKAPKSQTLDWVLGRVDTRTGKLLGTYHLDLPGDLGHVIHGPEISLLGVTGGAVWLRTGQGAGTLVRVTVRPTRAN